MSREIRFPAAAVAALAQGQRIVAIKRVRESNPGMDLREAMETVDAYASGGQRFTVDAPAEVAIAPVDGLPAEAIAALSRGQVIEAIKIVRAATGLGLKEAKDLVEQYRDGQAPVRDEAMRAKLEGIARKHGMKLPEAALVAVERGDLKAALNLVRQAKESAPHAVGTARGANTVSRESNRYGWLWALTLLVVIAVGYYWYSRM
ncbi:MAG TPA: 50S ribosomal protein L7/L12 [Pseudoxanthomonas sp.]